MTLHLARGDNITTNNLKFIVNNDGVFISFSISLSEIYDGDDVINMCLYAYSKTWPIALETHLSPCSKDDAWSSVTYKGKGSNCAPIIAFDISIGIAKELSLRDTFLEIDSYLGEDDDLLL